MRSSKAVYCKMPEGLLLSQFAAYPRMQPQDAVKLLHQVSYGAGHAIADALSCIRDLREELACCNGNAARPLVEPLRIPDRAMCRVHMGALHGNAILPESLARLFMAGAEAVSRQKEQNEKLLEEGLCTLFALADAGRAPFSKEACEEYLLAYRQSGNIAVSHSEAYRRAYQPAYRVLPEAYAQLLPLCSEIDRLLQRRKRVVLCIDGRCAAGKSSLARLLSDLYGAACIRMDDFFLPQELRTPARLAEPGGNIHYERVATEVAAPLKQGKRPVYRRFDCKSMAYAQPQQVMQEEGLLLVEGTYSLHPRCEIPCDIGVFLCVDASLQRARLHQREDSESYARFLTHWIPLEEAYFANHNVMQACTCLTLPEDSILRHL